MMLALSNKTDIRNVSIHHDSMKHPTFNSPVREKKGVVLYLFIWEVHALVSTSVVSGKTAHQIKAF